MHRVTDGGPDARYRLRRRAAPPLAGGRSFGTAGPYEELKGRVRFVLDPEALGERTHHRRGQLCSAQRSRLGNGSIAADVSLLLPVERSRGNGRVLLDVVNRGNTVAVPNFNRATRSVFVPDSDRTRQSDVGDGFLMRHGYAVASCG